MTIDELKDGVISAIEHLVTIGNLPSSECSEWLVPGYCDDGIAILFRHNLNGTLIDSLLDVIEADGELCASIEVYDHADAPHCSIPSLRSYLQEHPDINRLEDLEIMSFDDEPETYIAKQVSTEDCVEVFIKVLMAIEGYK